VGFRDCSQTRRLLKVHSEKGTELHLELIDTPAGILPASQTQRM